MMAFLLAVVAVIGIGFGASVVLERYQSAADVTFVGAGAKPGLDPKLHQDAAKK